MALWGLLGCSEAEPVAVLEPEAAALQRLGSACSVVIAIGGMDAADADHLARVRDGNVMSLRLRDVTCPNNALAELAALSSLIHLDLSRTSITSLEHVPTLDLADLILSDTPISSLADIERLSPSYRDLRGTRVTSLDDLPASVTVLHAQGLGLTVPEGRTFSFIDVGNGDESKPADALTEAAAMVAAEPLPDDMTGRSSDISAQCGSVGPCRGSVGSGSGMVQVVLTGLHVGGGRLKLNLGGGDARVWLKDIEGTWRPHVLEGEAELNGHFGNRGLYDKFFYVQGEFSDLSWEVL